MAKQSNKLDCGCFAKPDEQAVHVVKVFVCSQALASLLKLALNLHPKSQAKPLEKTYP